MNKINAICLCGKIKEITMRCYKSSVKKYKRYKCLRCIIKERGSKNGDGIKNKVRNAVGLLNHDKMTVKCIKCGSIIKVQYKSLKVWKKKHNSDYICGACLNAVQDRSKSRTREYRENCSKRSRKYWSNPEYRDKIIKHLAKIRSLGPGPSNLERTVWRYLDDLGVNFKSARDGESFTLGPWSFDIMIDKSELIDSDQNLLIEIDGFYRHNRPDVVHYDRAKETYINEYYKDYKLVHILEHEFLAPGKLKSRLNRLLGRESIRVKAIDLDELLVDKIDFSLATPFLGAYHYLGFVNKRGIPIGCFDKEKNLIAVVLFAGLTRKESASRLGLKQKECRELIRFCISPHHHNQNLGSWFMSKAVKKLKSLIPEVKVIVTFADNSVGHKGGLYRASNFEFDGTCGDSYCWLSPDGFIMHKKTMWDHASKNGLSETDMAIQSNYVKLKCLPKNRFLFWIDEVARCNYRC